MIVFRALGFVADHDILEHVIYDFDDAELTEMVRASFDEAYFIQEQSVALNFIGNIACNLPLGGVTIRFYF